MNIKLLKKPNEEILDRIIKDIEESQKNRLFCRQNLTYKEFSQNMRKYFNFELIATKQGIGNFCSTRYQAIITPKNISYSISCEIKIDLDKEACSWWSNAIMENEGEKIVKFLYNKITLKQACIDVNAIKLIDITGLEEQVVGFFMK